MEPPARAGQSVTQSSGGSLPGCTSWQLERTLFRGVKFLIDWRQVVDDGLQLQFGPVHQVGPTGPKLKKWQKPERSKNTQKYRSFAAPRMNW